MKLLVIIIFIFSNFCSFGQNDTIYFNEYWRQCSKEETSFYRVYSKSGDSFLIKDYYSTGQLQMQTISTNIMTLDKNGRTIFYYQNGKIEKEGDYKNNKEEGEWKYWYENGQLENKGNYKDGKKEQTWENWHLNGTLSYKGEYAEGEKNGEWQYWYKNEQLKEEGVFIKGKKSRDWKGYHENGVLSYKEFYNKEGKLDGNISYWHENEQLSSEKKYKNGKIIQGGSTFYENGKTNLIYDYSSDGEKIGDWIQYYDNGQLCVKGSFKSDEKDGEWVEYFEDKNVIKNKGKYKEGLKNGDWNYNSIEGKQLALVNYKNNEISSEKYFNEKGEKVKSENANRNPFFMSDENNDLKQQLSLILNISNDSVVEGETVVGLTINADGSVDKVSSVESITPFIDTAFVEAFKKLPNFNVGKKLNRPEKFYLDVKIRLKANNTINIQEYYYITYPTEDIDIKNSTAKDEVFTIVENMPEYPGGIKELFTFLGQTVRYPSAAKSNSISGKVYVNFVVRKTGLVTNVKIIRGVHDLLDNESLRVVKLFPLWNPGSQRGIPVNVSYNLPINFHLK